MSQSLYHFYYFFIFRLFFFSFFERKLNLVCCLNASLVAQIIRYELTLSVSSSYALGASFLVPSLLFFFFFWFLHVFVFVSLSFSTMLDINKKVLFSLEEIVIMGNSLDVAPITEVLEVYFNSFGST